MSGRDSVKRALMSHLADVKNFATSAQEQVISGVRNLKTNVLEGLSADSADQISRQIKQRDKLQDIKASLDQRMNLAGVSKFRKDKMSKYIKQKVIPGLKEINNPETGLEALQRKRLGAQVLAGGAILGATIGTGLLAKSLYDKISTKKDKLNDLLDTRDREDGANLHS